MNLKAIVGLVAVVILGLAVWFYSGTKAVVATDADGDKDGSYASVSFKCLDNTHFVAEFTNDEKLNVVVDGKTMSTLAAASGTENVYENAAMKYAFAGEEAMVTNKATGATTTCSQPQDPNNAPFNFGDSAEGAGSQQDIRPIVGESIQGTWRSNQDKKNTRTFKDAGAVEDMYDGKVVSTSTYIVFTKANPVSGVKSPLQEDVAYIQIITTGKTASTMTFKVATVTPEELDLMYLDKGGVLSYTFVK